MNLSNAIQKINSKTEQCRDLPYILAFVGAMV